MNIKLYVEGGGDHNKTLDTQCRRGFSEFVRKAGLEGRMPRVVACGGRRRAFDSFRTAHENAGSSDYPMLLVDSEAPVTAKDPWDRVRRRRGDEWERPAGASVDQLHFMVQAMEAWFHADKGALQEYYGKDFRADALSPRSDIEGVAKKALLDGLKQATKECLKGEYSKGEHSFEIVERIDPKKAAAASEWARRFVDMLKRKAGGAPRSILP